MPSFLIILGIGLIALSILLFFLTPGLPDEIITGIAGAGCLALAALAGR